MMPALALAASVHLGARTVPPPLASYRAIYAVSLEHTSGAVLAAHGRMAVEFRDTCDGWSTTQRLIDDMTDSEGTPSRTDFIVTAWESRDGRTMRFAISETRDGKTKLRQRGSATLEPDGSGHVDLIEGKPAKFALPRGTQFPTRQILSVLAAARAGRSAERHIVFEGGDPTDINFSTVAIGREMGAAALSGDHAADVAGLLRHARAWPVLFSYFQLSARSETPDYEVAAHFFDNGISGSMSFIYPGYRLRVMLTRLEALRPSC